MADGTNNSSSAPLPETAAIAIPQLTPEQVKDAMEVAQRLDPDLQAAVNAGNTAVISAVAGGATTTAQVVDAMIKMGIPPSQCPPGVAQMVDARLKEFEAEREREAEFRAKAFGGIAAFAAGAAMSNGVSASGYSSGSSQASASSSSGGYTYGSTDWFQSLSMADYFALDSAQRSQMHEQTAADSDKKMTNAGIRFTELVTAATAAGADGETMQRNNELVLAAGIRPGEEPTDPRYKGLSYEDRMKLFVTDMQERHKDNPTLLAVELARAAELAQVTAHAQRKEQEQKLKTLTEEEKALRDGGDTAAADAKKKEIEAARVETAALIKQQTDLRDAFKPAIQQARTQMGDNPQAAAAVDSTLEAMRADAKDTLGYMKHLKNDLGIKLGRDVYRDVRDDLINQVDGMLMSGAATRSTAQNEAIVARNEAEHVEGQADFRASTSASNAASPPAAGDEEFGAAPVTATRTASINIPGQPPIIGEQSPLLAQLGAPEPEAAPADVEPDPTLRAQAKAPAPQTASFG